MSNVFFIALFWHKKSSDILNCKNYYANSLKTRERNWVSVQWAESARCWSKPLQIGIETDTARKLGSETLTFKYGPNG